MDINSENNISVVNRDHLENVVKPKRIIKVSLIFIVLIIIGLASFSLGYYHGLGGAENIKQRIVGKDAPVRFEDVDFSRFWEAFSLIEDEFIGDVDYEKAVDGAIFGMVNSLGDPFTAYFDKDMLNQFNEEINGTFEGIGAEISIRNNRLMIVAPIAGSPAEKAGLRSGDAINTIDGESVANMTIDEAIMKIRGKKGTAVVLNISRSGQEKPFDVKINRDVINVKSLDYKINDDGTAYIRILRFDPNTKALLEEAAKRINNNKVRGIVLDLRNDPGGYLDAAIDVSSQFIKEGVVVYEEYKDGRKDALVAKGGGMLYDIPVVVLVNGGSASASEIVAGAISDHKRGILVGEKTFGKGSVQEMSGLSSGGAVKVTIAKWLTPNGIAIDKNGLTPDIEVKWEEDGDVNRDNQLERAYQELVKNIK